MAIWEFAEGLARRGHEVHVIHTGLLGSQIRDLAEVDWFDFGDDVQHHFSADPSDAGQWPSDFVFCLFGEPPPDRGLPLMWVQAYQGFPAYVEKTIFGAPFPKVCTSTFLRDTAVRLGVRPEQAVHVPYGLNHDKYRVITPVGERPPRVAMLFHEAPIKGAAVGIAALEQVKQRLPELEVVLFGVADEQPAIPDWMTYRYLPSQRELVDDIFNGSRVFVMPSLLEGFGLVATEAMACGCALVASDSGGPRLRHRRRDRARLRSRRSASHGRSYRVGGARSPTCTPDSPAVGSSSSGVSTGATAPPVSSRSCRPTRATPIATARPNRGCPGRAERAVSTRSATHGRQDRSRVSSSS